MKLQRKLGVLALSSLPVLASAQTSSPAEAAITSASTTILAMVAIGGAAMVAIKLAMVGWAVGAKFVARLGNKA